MFKDTPEGQTNYCTHPRSMTDDLSVPCNTCLGKIKIPTNEEKIDTSNNYIQLGKIIVCGHCNTNFQWIHKSVCYCECHEKTSEIQLEDKLCNHEFHCKCMDSTCTNPHYNTCLNNKQLDSFLKIPNNAQRTGDTGLVIKSALTPKDWFIKLDELKRIARPDLPIEDQQRDWGWNEALEKVKRSIQSIYQKCLKK